MVNFITDIGTTIKTQVKNQSSQCKCNPIQSTINIKIVDKIVDDVIQDTLETVDQPIDGHPIGKQDYERLSHAKHVLCSFCEGDCCDICQVNFLINQALDELDEDLD